MNFVAQHPVRVCEEFDCALDEYRSKDGASQMLVIHFEFFKFTKEALRKMLTEWALFRQCVTAPLFAYCAPSSAATDADDREQVKWERFVRFLGFQKIEGVSVPCATSSDIVGCRPIYVHILKDCDVEERNKHFTE